jgi:hypothetical protein
VRRSTIPSMTTLFDVLNALGERENRNYVWSDASAATDDITGGGDTSFVESLLEEAATRGLVSRRRGDYDPEYQLTRDGSMYVATENQ